MADGRPVTPDEGGTEGLRGNRRPDGPGPLAPASPDPSLPARLRAFHERLPLAGERGTLPDDQVLYLAAVLRDTPQQPLAMTPGAWQGFLDLLRPHGVSPLMA